MHWNLQKIIADHTLHVFVPVSYPIDTNFGEILSASIFVDIEILRQSLLTTSYIRFCSNAISDQWQFCWNPLGIDFCNHWNHQKIIDDHTLHVCVPAPYPIDNKFDEIRSASIFVGIEIDRKSFFANIQYIFVLVSYPIDRNFDGIRSASILKSIETLRKSLPTTS